MCYPVNSFFSGAIWEKHTFNNQISKAHLNQPKKDNAVDEQVDKVILNCVTPRPFKVNLQGQLHPNKYIPINKPTR